MPVLVESRIRRKRKLLFLAIATAVFFFFCYRIASPYLNAIVGAAVLATLFHPVFRTLKDLTGGRSNLAAWLCILVLLVTLIGPAILIGILLHNESIAVYDWLRTNTAAQNGWPTAISSWVARVADWVGVHTGVDPDTLRSAALSRINEVGNFFVQKTGALLGGISSAILSLVITLFTFFFMLRSGATLVRNGARLLPLDEDEIEVLISKITAAIQGNVAGVLAVGGTQAILLGLGFWIFGVPSPVLWAIVTVACSVIPMGGAALVWVPGAIYLFASHSILKGVLMLAWGAGIVSLSDNIVRPWVLSDRVNMSPLLIFFALLGGIQVFGFWGIFLGPVILSLAVTFASMLLEEWQNSKPLENTQNPVNQP
jgi:predicted PurR-regulated permease PerM